jgi:hypothetical protein
MNTDRRRFFLAAALAVTATTLVCSPALAGCPPEPWPQEACASFGRTTLAIDAAGNFDWKAAEGPEANAARFVDPSASYRLCAWDEERLVVAADIPADAECPGGSCWSGRERKSRTYTDEAGANGDVRSLELTGSAASPTRLRAEATVIGGLILPMAGGVIVQMMNTDSGACLESFVPADAFTRDDKAAFAARFQADRPR